MVDQGKEEDEKESEEDLDQSEGVIITQKILNIMATFLDGEVSFGRLCLRRTLPLLYSLSFKQRHI